MSKRWQDLIAALPEEQQAEIADAVEDLLRELQQAKNDHGDMVRRNAVLRDRTDLPADRLTSIARYEAKVQSLQKQIEELAALLGEAAESIKCANQAVLTWNPGEEDQKIETFDCGKCWSCRVRATLEEKP